MTTHAMTNKFEIRVLPIPGVVEFASPFVFTSLIQFGEVGNGVETALITGADGQERPFTSGITKAREVTATQIVNTDSQKEKDALMAWMAAKIAGVPFTDGAGVTKATFAADGTTELSTGVFLDAFFPKDFTENEHSKSDAGGQEITWTFAYANYQVIK